MNAGSGDDVQIGTRVTCQFTNRMLFYANEIENSASIFLIIANKSALIRIVESRDKEKGHKSNAKKVETCRRGKVEENGDGKCMVNHYESL